MLSISKHKDEMRRERKAKLSLFNRFVILT